MRGLAGLFLLLAVVDSAAIPAISRASEASSTITSRSLGWQSLFNIHRRSVTIEPLHDELSQREASVEDIANSDEEVAWPSLISIKAAKQYRREASTRTTTTTSSPSPSPTSNSTNSDGDVSWSDHGPGNGPGYRPPARLSRRELEQIRREASTKVSGSSGSTNGSTSDGDVSWPDKGSNSSHGYRPPKRDEQHRREAMPQTDGTNGTTSDGDVSWPDEGDSGEGPDGSGGGYAHASAGGDSRRLLRRDEEVDVTIDSDTEVAWPESVKINAVSTGYAGRRDLSERDTVVSPSGRVMITEDDINSDFEVAWPEEKPNFKVDAAIYH